MTSAALTQVRAVTLSGGRCLRRVMLQTEAEPQLNPNQVKPSVSDPHSRLQPAFFCSPTIDSENIFSNLRQTQLLCQSAAGSRALNDVNYPATNDSNTPENRPPLSDIPLPCRSHSFKCKSAFISPRCRNSSLLYIKLEESERERDIPQDSSVNIQSRVADNLREEEKGSF